MNYIPVVLVFLILFEKMVYSSNTKKQPRQEFFHLDNTFRQLYDLHLSSMLLQKIYFYFFGRVLVRDKLLPSHIIHPSRSFNTADHFMSPIKGRIGASSFVFIKFIILLVFDYRKRRSIKS